MVIRMGLKVIRLSAIILMVLLSTSIGNTSFACAQQSYTSEIVLFEGWNLIGLPFTPEDPSIEVVLADILDNVESVWAYDGETGYWFSYSPGAPSDLMEMIDRKGYWINIKVNTLLTVYAPGSPPKHGEPGSSRFFPADIGTPVTCAYEDYFGSYSALITVKELIRGPQAWSMIIDANMFNDPPREGYEYILVKIKFELLSAPTAETYYRIDGRQFDAVSNEGLVYDTPSVVEPEPQLDIKLYPGAFYEGWATFEVYETDSSPVLNFGMDYYGSGGVWFKLYE